MREFVASVVALFLSLPALGASGTQRLNPGSGYVISSRKVVTGSADRDFWWNGLEVVPGIAGYSAGVLPSISSVSTVDAKKLAWATFVPRPGEVIVLRRDTRSFAKYVAIRVVSADTNSGPLAVEWAELTVPVTGEQPCQLSRGEAGVFIVNRCLSQACDESVRSVELAYSAADERRCKVKPIDGIQLRTDQGIEIVDGIVDPRGAIIEGDIRVHPDQLGSGGPARGTGRTSIAARWPGGRVPFTIDGTIVDDPANPDDVFDRVQWAITHWNTNTPVRLVQVVPAPGKPCGANEVDCVTFRIAAGCSSNVGRVGGQQFIELDNTCIRGSVAHEIGHAVGLFHEQSAEFRDNFVTVNMANVQAGREHNFNKFTASYSDGLDVSSYDYDSIMHYPSNAFSTGGATIVRTDGGPNAALGQRNGLSDRDRAAIEAMYGSFAFSYRNALPGRTCIATDEPADPHGWRDNYFCASKAGARWSYSGPVTGRCTQILEVADPNKWSDNFLCVDPLWREHFTWSSAGPVAGQRCISFYEPSDPDTWHDNFLCWVEADPSAPPFMDVRILLENIDDDAFVWVGGTPGRPQDAVCSARFANGVLGSADCDLTAIASRQGLNYEHRFTIKFGNGGGFNSQGKVRVLANGTEKWSKTKGNVIRHTGWFYHVVLSIHFISGNVTVRYENECRNWLDCHH